MNNDWCGYKNGVTWVWALWLYSAEKEPYDYICGVCDKIKKECALGYSTPELRLHWRKHQLARKIEAYANQPTRWVKWREDANTHYRKVAKQENTHWDHIDWQAIADLWEWRLLEDIDTDDE